MEKEYWKKTDNEIRTENAKETKRQSNAYADYDEVNHKLENINYQTNNPDAMPLADYQVFPVHLKPNWDYPVDNHHSEEFLTGDECDLVISKWEDKNLQDFEQNMTYRICDIKWVSHYQPGWEWLYEKLHSKLKSINDRIFKFNLTNPVTIESLQFTKYEPGGLYRPHLDWSGKGVQSTRKLSFTINLTNPDDYTGGGLKIHPKIYPTKDRGNIVVFPSFLKHEAIKVKTGTRHALISWVNGDAFK